MLLGRLSESPSWDKVCCKDQLQGHGQLFMELQVLFLPLLGRCESKRSGQPPHGTPHILIALRNSGLLFCT